jgi:large subunit ribosomal protein L10
MNKTEKTEVVSSVKEMIENSSAIYLADYSGINVEDISKIRNDFRKEKVRYKVYKNTLFKRALDELGKYDKLADHLTGMTGYVFATENPVAPAKIIKKYFDETKKLSLKACYIDQQFYEGSNLDMLAALPSKNELIAGIMGSLKSPASGIVGTMTAVTRNLANVIDQVAKQKAA